jgi:choline-sulfatase
MGIGLCRQQPKSGRTCGPLGQRRIVPDKLVYYINYPPQLFDLAVDPEELNDIAGQASARPVIDELKAELFRICDPEAVNRQAKADQHERLAAVGGKAFAIRRGDLGFSPPPGIRPDFS